VACFLEPAVFRCFECVGQSWNGPRAKTQVMVALFPGINTGVLGHAKLAWPVRQSPPKALGFAEEATVMNTRGAVSGPRTFLANSVMPIEPVLGKTKSAMVKEIRRRPTASKVPRLPPSPSRPARGKQLGTTFLSPVAPCAGSPTAELTARDSPHGRSAAFPRFAHA